MDFFFTIITFVILINQIYCLKLYNCGPENPIQISSPIKEVIVGCETDEYLNKCTLQQIKNNLKTEICSLPYSSSTYYGRWWKTSCKSKVAMISYRDSYYKCEFRTNVTLKGLTFFHLIIIPFLLHFKYPLSI
jgi:hypothetical protein